MISVYALQTDFNECVLSVALRDMYIMVVFDVTVIVILLLSLLLCVRSLKAGVLLQIVSFCNYSSSYHETQRACLNV